MKPLLVTDNFILKKSYGPLDDVQYLKLEKINCLFRLVLKHEKEYAMRTAVRVFLEDLCNEAILMYRRVLV